MNEFPIRKQLHTQNKKPPATDKLNDGEAQSLVQLAGEWEAKRQDVARREMEETLADIHASHADIEAGRVLPVADAFAAVRQQLALG